MEARQRHSRKQRAITVCTECHRRKQKCDRAYPCNFCTSRGVPGRCSYVQGHVPSNRSSSRIDLHVPPARAPTVPEAADRIRTPESPPPPPPPPAAGREEVAELLREQVGYSHSNFGHNLASWEQTSPRAESVPASGLASENHVLLVYQSLLEQLPTPDLYQQLIDNYFSQANWNFNTLQPVYFRQLLARWLLTNQEAPSSRRDLQRSSHMIEHFYFPALLFQTLAVSLQFLPPTSAIRDALGLRSQADCDRLSHRFSDHGAQIAALFPHHHARSITAVEHDLMRSLWLKNGGKGIESWYLLGSAIRKAQDLGLHQYQDFAQDPEDAVETTLSNLWYDEYKRRLWVTLFIWDSHMSLLLGRPRAIHMSDCSAQTPTDYDFPEKPARTVPQSVNSTGKPSSYRSHLFNYALGFCIHDMLSQNINKRSVDDYDKVWKLHAAVEQLLDNLPPALRLQNPDTTWDTDHIHIARQRQKIKLHANLVLIALHRQHAEIHLRSREATIRAAIDALEALQVLFESLEVHQYRIYGLSCVSIDACVFLCFALQHFALPDMQQRQRLLRCFEDTRTRLEKLKSYSQIAETGLILLERTVQRIPSLGHISTPKEIANTALPELESGAVIDNQLQSDLDLFDFGQNGTFNVDAFEDYIWASSDDSLFDLNL